MYHNGQTSTEIDERVPCLEFSKLFESGDTGDEERDTKPALESLPSPRLPFHVIPKGDNEPAKCKYIYLMRNPKDVTVSFYHFSKSFDDGKSCRFRGPWEFYVKLFLQGKGKDLELFFCIIRQVHVRFSDLFSFICIIKCWVLKSNS